MEHFVTIFDQSFIPQGLALHHSLSRFAGKFKLWVLSMDQETHDFIEQLSIKTLSPLLLSDYETDELRQASRDRSLAEYCWTLTPFSIQWVFLQGTDISRVTYVDADVFFLSDPLPLFHEFDISGRSVLITEHEYAPEHDQTSLCGRYCVQFLIVKRYSGAPVLNWWSERCLEWCYARFKDGYFGDQAYLIGFMVHFPELIFVLQGHGRLLAPWNATYYRYSDAIMYHFHGLRIFSPKIILACKEILPFPVMTYVYSPYIRLLQQLIASHQLNWIRPQMRLTLKWRLKLLLSRFILSFRRLKYLPCPVFTSSV